MPSVMVRPLQLEVEPSNKLFPSPVRFRFSVHLHRRRRTQQGLLGGYKWTGSAVCVHRACGRARPGKHDVLAVD